MIDGRIDALTIVVALACVVGTPAWSQSANEAPSLDELLGLPGDSGSPAEPADTAEPMPADPAMGEFDEPTEAAEAVELDPEVARRLRGEAMSANPFESSLVDMTEAADRLGRHQDPGLTTQRIMQDAIDKLDQAIAAAKRQQSGGGESQDQSEQQDSDSGGQELAQQSSGQQRSGAASASAQQSSGEHGGDASPGSAMDAQGESDSLTESRREWGSLPPRVRRELTEGVNERISPLYRSLTERYFEALSEER